MSGLRGRTSCVTCLTSGHWSIWRQVAQPASITAREILLERESALAVPLALLRRKLAQGGVILDASLTGGTLAVLTKSGRRELAVSRLSAHGLTTRVLCTTPLWLGTTATGQPLVSADNVKVRIFGIDSAGRESYAPGLPIAILHQAGPTPGRDAIVSFDGGPDRQPGRFLHVIDEIAVARPRA